MKPAAVLVVFVLLAEAVLARARGRSVRRWHQRGADELQPHALAGAAVTLRRKSWVGAAVVRALAGLDP